MPATTTLIEPAHELRRALDSGQLLTPWAQERCGQEITADVQRTGPPYLDYEEAALLGLARDANWACLRRSGRLVQADGTEVARITSVIALSRITLERVRMLQATHTPLGTALGEAGGSKVLWCSVGICEYAVACGRLITSDGEPVALTTDWVLWSWLGSVSPPVRSAACFTRGPLA
jgi:hypothetical protein